jgi:ribulose-5-phosphate 4-epimerase/fuculose-1-phosphate aldolase
MPVFLAEGQVMDRPQFLLGVLAASCAAAAPAVAADAPAPTFADLALANHILAHENVVDGYGHVSVRSPHAAQNYWLARSMAPALVSENDIFTYDLESNSLNRNYATPYAERFIHGAIYKARPDVMAVVHAHTPAVIPFGVSPVRLQPVFHMAAFLGSGVPVFEIRDSGGTGTDLLVKTQALGEALARTLGSANVALLRGLGLVAVGSTLPEAVFRAYYPAQNAQLEAAALRLGTTPNYLTADEARAAMQTQSGLIGRAYDLWKRAAAP